MAGGLKNLYRNVLPDPRKIGTVAIQSFEHDAAAASAQTLFENISTPQHSADFKRGAGRAGVN
jgi:hypothetical protein